MTRRVLVFPAGTEIGLEIFHALAHCAGIAIFGAGQDISNPAKFVYPEYHALPSIHEEGWLDELVHLCQRLRIDYIFPAYDDVIVALSAAADRLPAKVISSPPQACAITRSKSLTYRELAGIVPTPKIYASPRDIDAWPVLVKPDQGQGSFGVTRVDDAKRLAAVLAATCEAIVCEYLPGDEYTVDCFSDREHGLLYAGARQRRRIRNGIAVNTVTCELSEAEKYARLIGRKLGLRGAWFFQLKRARDERLTLLEVAPRIAGAMATHRVMGINFPLLSIFEQERLPLAVRPLAVEVELDRCLANRYRHSITFDTLYIDLDDTLLVDGQVNLQALKLIFQCINAGRKVVLLTRHDGDLEPVLRRHRLFGLFDHIVHLHTGEKKSLHIQSGSAVFVDDSFAERMEVADAKGIPTFDCSMLEMLTEQAAFTNKAETINE
jgi:hypothetical protein